MEGTGKLSVSMMCADLMNITHDVSWTRFR